MMVTVPGVSGEAVTNLVSSAHIRCSNVGLRCSTFNSLPSYRKGTKKTFVSRFIKTKRGYFSICLFENRIQSRLYESYIYEKNPKRFKARHFKSIPVQGYGDVLHKSLNIVFWQGKPTPVGNRMPRIAKTNKDKKKS